MDSLLIALSLRLVNTHGREICGCVLFEDHAEIADFAISEGWLVVSGKNRQKYTAEGKYADLVWCDDYAKYRYFAFNQWCYLDEKLVYRYKLNIRVFLNRIRNLLNLPVNKLAVDLMDESFWHLGKIGDNGGAVHVYYICAHLIKKYNDTLDKILEREFDHTPALILTSGKSEWIDNRRNNGWRLVELQTLIDRSSDKFRIDEDYLRSVIAKITKNDMTVVGRDIVFSEGYRTVAWHGKTYKFTKKQAVIVQVLSESNRKVQGDILSSAAETSQTVSKIMRSRKAGKWVRHPLLGTLIKDDGNSFFYLDKSAVPPVRD